MTIGFVNLRGVMARTKGERLFEEYLAFQGFIDVEYEKSFPSKSKHPDYSLNVDGVEYLFDVKDFEYYELPSVGLFSPEKKIRDRIDDAREKFKEFKEWPCSLVLYNNNAPLMMLTEPHAVLAAMLGNVGIAWEVDMSKGASVPNSEREVFMSGGKMVHPHTGQPQNTTISAIITLRHTSRTKSGKTGLGFIVWENPVARIQFPRSLFCGRFDKRYGLEGDNISCVFVGDGLSATADQRIEGGSSEL